MRLLFTFLASGLALAGCEVLHSADRVQCAVDAGFATDLPLSLPKNAS